MNAPLRPLNYRGNTIRERRATWLVLRIIIWVCIQHRVLPLSAIEMVYAQQPAENGQAAAAALFS
jgi:hypothetical protein